MKSLFEMTEEERQEVRATNPPVVGALHSADMYFDWGWSGCGFGQLSFHYDREKGEIRVDNECMSRHSVRQILHAFADFIADRALLNDNPDEVPPVDFKKELAEAAEWAKKNGLSDV